MKKNNYIILLISITIILVVIIMVMINENKNVIRDSYVTYKSDSIINNTQVDSFEVFGYSLSNSKISELAHNYVTTLIFKELNDSFGIELPSNINKTKYSEELIINSNDLRRLTYIKKLIFAKDTSHTIVSVKFLFNNGQLSSIELSDFHFEQIKMFDLPLNVCRGYIKDYSIKEWDTDYRRYRIESNHKINLTWETANTRIHLLYNADTISNGSTEKYLNSHLLIVNKNVYTDVDNSNYSEQELLVKKSMMDIYILRKQLDEFKNDQKIPKDFRHKGNLTFYYRIDELTKLLKKLLFNKYQIQFNESNIHQTLKDMYE